MIDNKWNKTKATVFTYKGEMQTIKLPHKARTYKILNSITIGDTRYYIKPKYWAKSFRIVDNKLELAGKTGVITIKLPIKRWWEFWK